MDDLQTTPKQLEGLTHALAVLTAWCSADDDTGFAYETMQHLQEAATPDEAVLRCQELAGGLTSLSGMLLLHLAQCLDVSPQQILREYALHFASVEKV